jgi:membrane protein DedA with SNARE-associated domain
MTWILASAISFESVQQWILAGGYVVLFGLLFLCGLGLPVPEDIPLMISGALIATGKFHLLVAAPVAWCGIIGGDCVLYHLGKKFGLEITRLPLIGKHVTKQRIQKIEGLFSRYGVLVIGVGRMVAGVRGAMVVAAGAIRYNFLVFVIADGIGAIVSGGLFVWLGYWLGNKLQDNMDQIDKYKHRIALGAVALALVAVAYFVWRHRRSAARREMEATAAAIAQATPVPPQLGAPHAPDADDTARVADTSKTVPPLPVDASNRRA